MITNIKTKDFYVGQSRNLYNRLLSYFNPAYLKRSPTSRISRALLKYGYSDFTLTILEYCDKAILTEREQHYFDNLNPIYNIIKVAGASPGEFRHTKETIGQISKSLKGVYAGEKAYWYGKKMSAETKALMSSQRTGEKNPLFGKTHSESTKELIREKALGRNVSEDTKLLMSSSSKSRKAIMVYEKGSSNEFELIGEFVSIRRAAEALGIGHSSINSYVKSGKIFKDRYKFSTQENS